jgi:2-C-methyl-D-erythritol 4-phosphate cytidylyltransferase
LKKYAIIVAGGSGTRLNTVVPKQFMPLGGIPVLSYSIRAFHAYDPKTEIIVVLPERFDDQWKKLAHETHLNIPHKTVTGGHERFYSVLNALNTIHNPEGLVAIHDSARPFISVSLIDNCFKHAERNGCAVPAIPVKDSLRVKVMDDWTVADRSLFKAIQTPQIFHVDKLKAAYTRPFKPKYTDDATVYEDAGNKVYLIDGEDINFKITTSQDLEYGEYLVNKLRY